MVAGGSVCTKILPIECAFIVCNVFNRVQPDCLLYCLLASGEDKSKPWEKKHHDDKSKGETKTTLCEKQRRLNLH